LYFIIRRDMIILDFLSKYGKINQLFIKGDGNTMKWYEKSGAIFLLLLFVFPVGVFLLWKCGHWNKIIKIIATIFFGFVFLLVIIPMPDEANVDVSTEVNAPIETISEPGQKLTETEKLTEPVKNSEFELTQQPTQVPTPAEPTEIEEPQPEVEHRTGNDFVGISNKNISDIDVKFMGNVNNDVTGNWRYATIPVSENIDTIEYVLSYYRKYFKSDNEIHFIVNFNSNSLVSLNTFDGDTIYITVREHINGEERNAKTIDSGTKLGEYRIYTDNGDIEKLEEATEVAEQELEVEVPPAPPQVQMVWIPTNGGKKYHSYSTCSSMDNPAQVTIDEAQSRGFTPCKRCY